jgi:hypothetical protein
VNYNPEEQARRYIWTEALSRCKVFLMMQGLALLWQVEVSAKESQRFTEAARFRNRPSRMWSRGELSISVSVLPAFYHTQHAQDCSVGTSAEQDGILEV